MCNIPEAEEQFIGALKNVFVEVLEEKLRELETRLDSSWQRRRNGRDRGEGRSMQAMQSMPTQSESMARRQAQADEMECSVDTTMAFPSLLSRLAATATTARDARDSPTVSKETLPSQGPTEEDCSLPAPVDVTLSGQSSWGIQRSRGGHKPTSISQSYSASTVSSPCCE